MIPRPTRHESSSLSPSSCSKCWKTVSVTNVFYFVRHENVFYPRFTEKFINFRFGNHFSKCFTSVQNRSSEDVYSPNHGPKATTMDMFQKYYGKDLNLVDRITAQPQHITDLIARLCFLSIRMMVNRKRQLSHEL